MTTIDSGCVAGEQRVGPDGAVYQLVSPTGNFAYAKGEQWSLWDALLVSVQPGSRAAQSDILTVGKVYQIDAKSMSRKE